MFSYEPFRTTEDFYLTQYNKVPFFSSLFYIYRRMMKGVLAGVVTSHTYSILEWILLLPRGGSHELKKTRQRQSFLSRRQGILLRRANSSLSSHSFVRSLPWIRLRPANFTDLLYPHNEKKRPFLEWQKKEEFQEKDSRRRFGHRRRCLARPGGGWMKIFSSSGHFFFFLNSIRKMTVMKMANLLCRSAINFFLSR